MKDIIYWIWLAIKCGAGSSEGVRLLNYFSGAKEIYEASFDELLGSDKCDRDFLKRLTDHDLSKAESILEYCFLHNIHPVSCASENYPHRLRSLYNKPLVLYCRGNIANMSERLCVGVVGTRSMTNYGKHAAFDIVRNLCSYNALIISGAAYGIDSVANHTALFFECDTVAVLGTGVDVAYPSENRQLIDMIAERGMVISEFIPGSQPTKYSFPIRNRIISGLSDAVLVVEAGEKSGALITARRAADQKRPVYAVPGNIDLPESKGANLLIRDGASLCTCAEDIIDDFADTMKISRNEQLLKNEAYLHYEMQKSNRRLPKSAEYADSDHTRSYPGSSPKSEPSAGDSASQSEAVKPSDAAPAESPAPQPSARTETMSDTAANTPERTTAKIVNSRECIYSKLSELQKQVFDAMPDSGAISPDKLTQSGLSAGDVLASLTILELYAAVEALPGGLYRKIV